MAIPLCGRGDLGMREMRSETEITTFFSKRHVSNLEDQNLEGDEKVIAQFYRQIATRIC